MIFHDFSRTKTSVNPKTRRRRRRGNAKPTGGSWVFFFLALGALEGLNLDMATRKLELPILLKTCTCTYICTQHLVGAQIRFSTSRLSEPVYEHSHFHSSELFASRMRYSALQPCICSIFRTHSRMQSREQCKNRDK